MTVLDAYAVVAYLRDEESADEVAGPLRDGCVLASVNAAEVVDKLVRVYGRDADDVEADLALLGHACLRTPPLAWEVGVSAGRLRAGHYHRERCPVSMADCLAAATALPGSESLATSDPALAAVVRAEGGTVVALPDSHGRRP